MQIDWHTYLDSTFRWAHILSGIAWIGLLYFFNLVNVSFQGKLDAATKKIVNPELMPRALWWFRWAAMSTLIFGLILFYWVYMKGGLLREAPAAGETEGGLSGRARYIMWGMTLGVIMWFNVWFIIWPAQRKIIGGMKSGNPAPPEVAKRAFLASRFNTYASGPMLFLMVLSPHYSNFGAAPFAIAIVGGLLVIHLMIMRSSKVSTDV